jgi:hypothetical protein
MWASLRSTQRIVRRALKSARDASRRGRHLRLNAIGLSGSTRFAQLPRGPFDFEDAGPYGKETPGNRSAWRKPRHITEIERRSSPKSPKKSSLYFRFDGAFVSRAGAT